MTAIIVAILIGISAGLDMRRDRKQDESIAAIKESLSKNRDAIWDLRIDAAKTREVAEESDFERDLRRAAEQTDCVASCSSRIGTIP